MVAKAITMYAFLSDDVLKFPPSIATRVPNKPVADAAHENVLKYNCPNKKPDTEINATSARIVFIIIFICFI